MQVEHLWPKSRHGTDRISNLTLACHACNQRKGNRTPHDASMLLRSKPSRPRYIAVVLLGHGNAPNVWHKYLQGG